MDVGRTFERVDTMERLTTYRVYLSGPRMIADDIEEISASDDAGALATAEQVFIMRRAASQFTLLAPSARVVAIRRRCQIP